MRKKFVGLLALVLTLVVSIGSVATFADTASFQLESEGAYTIVVEQEPVVTFSPSFFDQICDGGPGIGRPDCNVCRCCRCFHGCWNGCWLCPAFPNCRPIH